MKLVACFFALLLISGIYAASAGSIITLDVNADKLSPGQIVQLNGSVDDSLAGKPVGIEVQDPEGHVILIRTVTSDSYGNFTLKFKIPSSTALGKLDIAATIEIDGQAFSESITKRITEAEATTEKAEKAAAEKAAAEKAATVQEIELEPEIEPEPMIQSQSAEEKKGGGCLIATATFGSEMAPQVQFLRELRDNTVLQTESGTSFMTGFNQFYYSFSPYIADYERENPAFKETVKLALTPLLTSLTLLQYVDIDSESEMLGYGIGIILLNIGMYFVAPAVLIMQVRKRI